MSVIDERVRGIEYELAVNTIPPSFDSLYLHRLVDGAVHGLERQGYIGKVDAKSSSFNAGMVYDDLGHLEISTPSYSDPLSAVVYDKVAELYAFIGSQAASEAEGRRVIIHKTNYSTFPSNIFERIGILRPELTSYATHGNLQVSRRAVEDWEDVLRTFIPNNIARILLFGSGDVVPGMGFVISPRALFTEKESSLSTVQNRGIVNERCWEHELNRNYADPKKYMRLHDIHYEGLRCFWNIFLRDCWQAFVVSAFEKGFLKGAPKIREPVKAFRELSKAWQGDYKLEGADGRKLDPVKDVLIEFYWDRILKCMASSEPSEMDKICMGQIEFALNKLANGRYEFFQGYGMDWITKKDWLEEYGVLKGGSIRGMNEARRVCRAFAWIDPTVLFYVGEEVDWSIHECLFDPRESLNFAKEMAPWIRWEELPKLVSLALRNGPEGTRDFFASEVLKRFSKDVNSRSWDVITFTSGRIELPEPLMLNQKEAGEMMGRVNSLGDLYKEVRSVYADYVNVF